MAPRILLIHSGHSFSTADVYDGVKVGLELAGAEVVEYRWDRHLATFSALTAAAIAQGVFPAERQQWLRSFAIWMASADALNCAIEQEVNAALVINGLLFPPQRAAIMNNAGIPIACYGTEAPYHGDHERALAPFYTHWFTQERRSVRGFAETIGDPTRAHYLPMAYNPLTHTPGAVEADKAADVVFVGGGYPERKAVLHGADWSGIDLRLFGTLWNVDLDQEVGKAPGASGGLYSQGAIPNSQTTALHRSARISLNLHRLMTTIESGGRIDPSEAESLGPRAYEIPAVGGCMLCDDSRPELADVFGDSVPTFRFGDSADLERQVRYLLTHPDARDRAQRAQHQAVQPHSWTARAQTILSILV